MSTVIAERVLDYFGDTGVQHGFARCDYELPWPGYQRKLRACAEECWRALQLAMQIIPLEISLTDDFKAGRLGWFGERMTTTAVLIKWLAPTSTKGLEE